jgi:hypothetical protein
MSDPGQNPPARSRTSPLVVGLLLAGAVLALALLWLAAETHYRSCVRAVDVRITVTDALTRLAKEEAIGECNRLPF